jgi:hypothetical protein
MDSRFVVGFVALLLLAGTYWWEFQLDSALTMPEDIASGPEALAWLKSNPSESALASNRFGETHNAVRFVQQLYSAGAKEVLIPYSSITSDDVETYADALTVRLPDDSDKRAAVCKLCAHELAREGFPSSIGPAETLVFLWWD